MKGGVLRGGGRDVDFITLIGYTDKVLRGENAGHNNHSGAIGAQGSAVRRRGRFAGVPWGVMKGGYYEKP